MTPLVSPHASRARRLVALLVSVLAIGTGWIVGTASPAAAASTFIIQGYPIDPLIAGSSADVVFTITNVGPDLADNVEVQFTLPAGVTYAGFSNANCAPAPAAPQLTCNLNPFAGIGVGETASVTVRVNIDADYIVDNGGGTNTATAIFDLVVDYTGGAQSKVLGLAVGEESDLRIEKYVNMAEANAGDTINYSIVVDNLGPSTARDVTIRDTLFRNFDPSGTSAALTIQSCAYSVSQGGGAITQFTCLTGPIVAAQFGTEVGTFKTNHLQPVGLYDDGAGGTVVGGRLRGNFRMVALEPITLDNEARVLSATVDPDTSNNVSIISGSVYAVSDLALTKAADVASTTPGGTIVYTLTATNNGPSTAVNTVIRDQLPANVELVSATVPGGTCIAGTPGDLDDPLECYLGSIPRINSTTTDPPPNFKVVTVTVKVKDDLAPTGSVLNRAWVWSDVVDLDNSDDAAQAIVAIVDAPHLFNPVTPARQFDTRYGTGGVPVGKVPAGTPLEFTAANVNGIPAGAAAVSLNVTVEGPESSGWLKVYPCATPGGTASTLNFTAGQTVANAVIAPVDAAGKVCFSSTATTNIISDVSGWFRAASGLTTLTPVREFDTRDGTGSVPVAKLAAGSVLPFKVTGVNGVPAAGVGAVALNVTVTNPEAAGHITVFPCGAPPVASNLNFVPGQTVPNLVVAPVNPDGMVCFATNAETDLLADLSGWFATGSELHTLNPSRVFDTRNGLGGVPVSPLLAGASMEVQVTGRNGVPGWGVGSVVLNVTATNTVEDGFITVFPCGDRTLTSNVNYKAGQTVPNAVIAPVSPQGTVCFYTNATTDLLADVSGWFTGAPIA